MLKEPHYFVWDGRRLREKDKGAIDKLNATLLRVSRLRAVELTISGHFLRSKIAWKLAYYQHALLHRVVALADGTAVTWNSNSILSSILSARALMETLAVMAELKRRVEESLSREDLADIDMVAQGGVFATRDKEVLKRRPEVAAINSLSYIKKLDKRLPGFLKHYDMLSERCHPNYFGHNRMFSELDRTDGTVRFSDERNPIENGQLIFTIVMLMPYVEILMRELGRLVLNVAELQYSMTLAKS